MQCPKGWVCRQRSGVVIAHEAQRRERPAQASRRIFGFDALHRSAADANLRRCL